MMLGFIICKLMVFAHLAANILCPSWNKVSARGRDSVYYLKVLLLSVLYLSHFGFDLNFVSHTSSVRGPEFQFRVTCFASAVDDFRPKSQQCQRAKYSTIYHAAISGSLGETGGMAKTLHVLRPVIFQTNVPGLWHRTRSFWRIRRMG